MADVAKYREFVPWCAKSELSSSIPMDQDDNAWLLDHPNGRVFYAELAVGFKYLRERYISRVWTVEGEYIKAQAIDLAMFDHLVSEWTIQSTDNPNECRVRFVVDFEFRSYAYAYIANLFFTQVVERMIEAFQKRCIEIYGSQ